MKKIFLVNDDGYKSPGLLALIKALKNQYDLSVVSTTGQRSWTAKSISYRSEVNQEVGKVVQKFSSKRLPKKIMALSIDWLTDHISRERKTWRFKINKPTEIRQGFTLMNSDEFRKNGCLFGFTNHRTMIIRVRENSFLHVNKKAGNALKRVFKKNKFFQALSEGKKLMKQKINNPLVS